MSDLIDLAKTKRAALAAEIAKLDAFIKTAQQLAAESTMTIASFETTGHSLPFFEDQPAKVSKKAQVLAACREIVSTLGPQSLSALYAALQSRGIDPGSKDPKGMLSIMLNRSEDFVSDREAGGWTLAKYNAPTGVSR